MRALVFAAALAAASPVLAQEPSAAPVVAAERAFAADAPSMGIAGSFNKWSVPDAILIAGGRAQRIGEIYPDGPRPADEPLLEWWPNFAGISRSGDLGFTTGGVAVGGRRTGHYFTIWKKQPDGSWKWVYDGGSGASAADVPGPETEPVTLPVSDAAPITPEQAMKILTTDVVLSEGMARQEVDRYTFRAPGQATSYFYGYTRLVELRADVEKAMGASFNQQTFHDFVLAQGLLPPALMREAVTAHFIKK